MYEPPLEFKKLIERRIRELRTRTPECAICDCTMIEALNWRDGVELGFDSPNVIACENCLLLAQRADHKSERGDRLCFACGCAEPRVIEADHIFGRTFEPNITIDLCRNHHVAVTIARRCEPAFKKEPSSFREGTARVAVGLALITRLGLEAHGHVHLAGPQLLLTQRPPLQRGLEKIAAPDIAHLAADAGHLIAWLCLADDEEDPA